MLECGRLNQNRKNNILCHFPSTPLLHNLIKNKILSRNCQTSTNDSISASHQLVHFKLYDHQWGASKWCSKDHLGCTFLGCRIPKTAKDSTISSFCSPSKARSANPSCWGYYPSNPKQRRTELSRTIRPRAYLSSLTNPIARSSRHLSQPSNRSIDPLKGGFG